MGWYGGSSGGGGGMAIGGAVTGSISGSILFADGSGHLAQNNADFFWDDTNLILKLGHSGTDAALYLNTLPAIYVVTNAIENNWFEGNAGNKTVTGYGNFGTGDLALSSVTTGYDNVAVGTKTMRLLTDGSQNFALGSFAMSSSTSDSNNTAIGTYTLTNIGLGGANAGGNNQNIAIGYGALNQASVAANNIAVGFSSLSNVTSHTAFFNIVMGNQAGNLLGTAYNINSNVFIGDHAGSNITGGSYNVWLGGYRGPSAGIDFSIALSDGAGANVLFDYAITHSGVWSISVNNNDGYWGALHIYGKQDAIGAAMTNYERAVLDWNTTANVFTIGTQAGGTGIVREVRYYSAGVPALYRVANASGDNWFEGGAGNFTVTGYNNFGTGSGALALVTTGHDNVGLGQNALTKLTTGLGNFAIGTGVLGNATTGNNNAAMGYNAMLNLTTGSSNAGVGAGALSNISTNTQNVAIGHNALTAFGTGGATGDDNVGIGFNCAPVSQSCSSSVLIGSQVGASIPNSNRNVMVGFSAAFAATGTTNFNVILGGGAFFGAGGGIQNTIIGDFAVSNFTGTCSHNTILGTWRGPSASVSNIIAISDGNATTAPQLDYTYTTSNVWSFQYSTTPIGLRVYNTTDSGAPPTNYERGCLDWNLTSNTFRLASQAGGTGVVRIIAIDGFSKAGAPANTDLPSGTWALIDDTTNNQTWLVFNKGGTIRKVQLT